MKEDKTRLKEDARAFFVCVCLASILTVAGIMEDDWELGIMGLLWFVIYVCYKHDVLKERVGELEERIEALEKMKDD